MLVLEAANTLGVVLVVVVVDVRRAPIQVQVVGVVGIVLRGTPPVCVGTQVVEIPIVPVTGRQAREALIELTATTCGWPGKSLRYKGGVLEQVELPTLQATILHGLFSTLLHQ